MVINVVMLELTYGSIHLCKAEITLNYCKIVPVSPLLIIIIAFFTAASHHEDKKAYIAKPATVSTKNTDKNIKQLNTSIVNCFLNKLNCLRQQCQLVVNQSPNLITTLLHC